MNIKRKKKKKTLVLTGRLSKIVINIKNLLLKQRGTGKIKEKWPTPSLHVKYNEHVFNFMLH